MVRRCGSAEISLQPQPNLSPEKYRGPSGEPTLKGLNFFKYVSSLLCCNLDPHPHLEFSGLGNICLDDQGLLEPDFAGRQSIH